MANKGHQGAKEALSHLESDLGVPREVMMRSQLEHNDIFAVLFQGITMAGDTLLARTEFVEFMKQRSTRVRKVKSELLPGKEERAFNLNRPLVV